MSRPTLPSGLEDFVDLFNKGAFWEAHEALEPEWRRTRSDFYHGLILYASAWVHHDRGNPHGIQAQLAKATPLLREHMPGYLGIDVSGILEQGRELAAGRPARAPLIITDLKLFAGDEPELGPGD
jgi:predicted metal-dependent hydrolase